MQNYNPSVYPQQQGFQPLAPQASGAPPPTYMPGQMYQQQPGYGYSGGSSSQQYLQQQYPQQQYPQQQYPQQIYPQQQFPQQYGAPQQYNSQAPYFAPTYNSQAPQGYSTSGYLQTGYSARPSTSSGFNMSSGLMGLAAGAFGGAVLEHVIDGRHHHNQGGGGMMPMNGMGMGMGGFGGGGNSGGGHHHHHHGLF